MDSPKILVNKDGFLFSLVKKNHYQVKFYIENKHIFVSKIVDFSMVKLIYDLNTDIYEKVDINRLNENEIILTLLITHFFEDLGMSQKFSYIHMKKVVETDRILFNAQSIKSQRPAGMPADSELLSIQGLNCICSILTPHSMAFSVDVVFDKESDIPGFAEKMIGVVLLKMFTRVKQFIENIRM